MVGPLAQVIVVLPAIDIKQCWISELPNEICYSLDSSPLQDVVVPHEPAVISLGQRDSFEQVSVEADVLSESVIDNMGIPGLILFYQCGRVIGGGVITDTDLDWRVDVLLFLYRIEKCFQAFRSVVLRYADG
jgi:hypothetical protein